MTRVEPSGGDSKRPHDFPPVVCRPVSTAERPMTCSRALLFCHSTTVRLARRDSMNISQLCLIGSIAASLTAAGWSSALAQQSTGGTPPAVTEGLSGQKSMGSSDAKGQSNEKSMIPSQLEPSGKSDSGDHMIGSGKGSTGGSSSKGSGSSGSTGSGSGSSGMGSSGTGGAPGMGSGFSGGTGSTGGAGR